MIAKSSKFANFSTKSHRIQLNELQGCNLNSTRIRKLIFAMILIDLNVWKSLDSYKILIQISVWYCLFNSLTSIFARVIYKNQQTNKQKQK